MKIVIKISTISNTIIPRKMTSRTPDHTTHTYDYAIRTKPRNLVGNHVIEIDQWKYSNTGISMGISTQWNQLISWVHLWQHLNQKWGYLSGLGRMEE